MCASKQESIKDVFDSPKCLTNVCFVMGFLRLFWFQDDAIKISKFLLFSGYLGVALYASRVAIEWYS